ncbi:MAG: sigma 54-interacting transcriptional regulator [Neptuniibacter sp.]
MSENRLLPQFKIKEKLRFNDDQCKITLDSNRMLLLHAEAFSHLKNELFNTLDPKVAQGLMIRMGYISGQLDADVVLKMYGSGDDDVFDLGPAIHGLEGFVHAEILEHKIDWGKGSFYGRVRCSGSVEAERYLQEHSSHSDCPVCWSVVGYASGYVSRFFKRFIVFKEIECKACGNDDCILVGKPAEAWADDDTYINYFKANYENESPLESELNKLRGARPFKQFDQGDLLGESKEFTKAFEYLTHAANTPINVLLHGETGVGKEVFARWLHKNSQRSESPFVAINCGAIPNDLIEAELFGVKRGAYTGASQSRPGRFELANGGTLFLDELGELSPSAQVKLLRVLQTGELERLGDSQTIKVDVRLVAATNVNLQEAIKQGDFRSDLYYRIATFPIEIPPLRERKSDIPILVDSMMEKYAPLYKKNILGISGAAMASLMNYGWPGNIRELQNIIERAVLLAPDNGMIEQIHLEHNRESHNPNVTVADNFTEVAPVTYAEAEVDIYKQLLDSNISLQAYELNLIKRAMETTDGNMTKAAKLLGITRRQIAYKLKQEV